MHSLLRHCLEPEELTRPPSAERWATILSRLDEELIRHAELVPRALEVRLQRLVDQLTHGIILEDENRRVVLANHGFCEMFRVPVDPSVLVGGDCEAMAKQAKEAFVDPDGFMARVDEVLRERQEVRHDVLTLRDGRVLERDYVPIFVDERYRGHLWSYRDVTSASEAERALAEARDAAEAATEAKDAFLAHMSHELRTPLTVVLGASQLLASSRPTAEQREFVEAITKSGKVLLGLIDDVLDYSKMRAGSFDVVSKSFHLREAIEDAVETQRGPARAKGLQLHLDFEPNLPSYASSDPLRLKQVVINLVSNAVKYTRHGVVRVSASSPAQGRLRVEVHDTGGGVEPDLLPKLFDPFRRGHDVKVHGTGLGLAISRQIIERLGGEIGAESEHGYGSTFWFEIAAPAVGSPKGDEARCRGDIELPTSIRPVVCRGHILVAEDNRFTQMILGRILERLGHTVTVVDDGAACIEAVESKRYDLIIMDGQMPRLDGYTAAARIRELGAHGERIPIVALTANARANARETCTAAGMDDYLCKPFVVAQVAETIDRWLRKRGPKQVVETPAADGGRPRLDMERLEALSGGDADFRHELTALFLEDVAGRLGELGAAAHDEESTRALAHNLKGACGNFGARRMEDIAARLCQSTHVDTDRVRRTVWELTEELRYICAALGVEAVA